MGDLPDGSGLLVKIVAALAVLSLISLNSDATISVMGREVPLTWLAICAFVAAACLLGVRYPKALFDPLIATEAVPKQQPDLPSAD